MLKHRLLFGILMMLAFVAVVLFDGLLDGSVTASITDDKPIQGTMLCVLIAVLAIPAQIEFSKLAALKNLKLFTPVTIVSSALFATAWYWPQLFNLPLGLYFIFLSAFTLFALFIYQYVRFQTCCVMANCGVNWFSIIYIGLLSSFVPAVAIDFGTWHLLMFVFVVKSSDIGAYTIGKLFGVHKFSPNISPAKTWEGLAGAIAVAIIVSILFAKNCDIMNVMPAVVFGACFAVIGQLGDLAESMIKRDVEQKDASDNIPGFGGLLDVIDSPLAAAGFAYLFFSCCSW